jgi:hypothetical protein
VQPHRRSYGDNGKGTLLYRRLIRLLEHICCTTKLLDQFTQYLIHLSLHWRYFALKSLSVATVRGSLPLALKAVHSADHL